MKSGGASRKGLKRHGMRAYRVRGPKGVQIIERDRPSKFFVYPEGWPRDGGQFFCLKFNRLYKAREHAEGQAGIS